ncbi:hypothetical protein BBK36DRAFT_1171341 [Trichoderma citrinoviride]|uniref:C2H2-type domain-containing protein n=1 Tax=Trichoderma citrinoviride TaxID=58853 RepID=A0A2T4B3K6_9HYPO|nr:hypothetical protein BBK36DRAFT_1171341 [Trichoderma citrinoviride]PTB63894.1 hypothetical protein BBK36DRAFT_1171341 [Trichoderma citrinoviride]
MGNNNTADCDSTARITAVSPFAMVLGQSIRDWGTLSPILRSIDDWVNGTSDQGVRQQRCCREEFASIGLLLRHCQERHSLSKAPTSQDAVSPDQDDVDKAHWGSFLFCDDCGTKHPETLVPVDSSQSPVSAVEREPFRCEDCGETFKLERNLREHLAKTHGKDDGLPCGQCDETFATEDYLMAHIRKDHGDPKPLKCQEPKCESSFASRYNPNEHVVAVHRQVKAFKMLKMPSVICSKNEPDYARQGKAWQRTEIQVDLGVCKAEFVRKGDLKRHNKNVHGINE